MHLRPFLFITVLPNLHHPFSLPFIIVLPFLLSSLPFAIPPYPFSPFSFASPLFPRHRPFHSPSLFSLPSICYCSTLPIYHRSLSLSHSSSFSFSSCFFVISSPPSSSHLSSPPDYLFNSHLHFLSLFISIFSFSFPPSSHLSPSFVFLCVTPFFF